MSSATTSNPRATAPLRVTSQTRGLSDSCTAKANLQWVYNEQVRGERRTTKTGRAAWLPARSFLASTWPLSAQLAFGTMAPTNVKVIVPVNWPASVEDGAFKVRVPIRPTEPRPCWAYANLCASLPRPANPASAGATGGAAAGFATVVKLAAVPTNPLPETGTIPRPVNPTFSPLIVEPG